MTGVGGLTSGPIDLPPPLLDLSSEGLGRAIDADSIGTRVLNGELPLEAHLDPDAAWAISPIVDPFRNVVASARFNSRSANRRIAEIASAFAARRTGFVWWRAPFHTPPDLGARLEHAGIYQVASSPAMAMDLRDLPVAEPLPDGLAIQGVTDETGLRDYIEALRADPSPPDEPPLFPPGVIEAIVAHTGPRLASDPIPMRYVGRVEGRPVATSRLSLAGGAAGIYAVVTAPDFRGRGIGRAMTLAPLHAARDLGYRIATLQSTDAGFRIYRAIGFRTVFEYAIHIGGMPG